MVLVKFWLHISEHEQLRRYRARERDPLKRWKLTDEDWRNLAHRADYERAVTRDAATHGPRARAVARDLRGEQAVRTRGGASAA